METNTNKYYYQITGFLGDQGKKELKINNSLHQLVEKILSETGAEKLYVGTYNIGLTTIYYREGLKKKFSTASNDDLKKLVKLSEIDDQNWGIALVIDEKSVQILNRFDTSL